MNLPENQDAERAILGAILLDSSDNALRQSATFKAEYFSLDSHKKIFTAMLSLHAAGLPIDFTTLCDELQKHGQLESVGGVVYVTSITDGLPRVKNIACYLKIVRDKAMLAYSVKLGDLLARKAQEPGAIASEILADLEQKTSNLRSWGSEGDGNLFINAKEFAETVPAEIPWVVNGFLAANATTLLIGKVKEAGKSTLVMGMVKAILHGQPFAGFETGKSGVVYLTEQPASSLREALFRAKLLGETGLQLLSWDKAMHMEWPAIMAMAERVCLDSSAKVLVVDTLSQFAGLSGDSENNAGDIARIMEPIQRAQAKGIAVLLIIHERKGGGSVADAGRGSSALPGIADIIFNLGRPEGNHPSTYRMLKSLSRFSETPDNVILEWTPDGYKYHGNEAAVAIEEAKAKLAQILPRSEDDAMTLEDLIQACGTSRSTLDRVIADFPHAVKVGAGKRGNPFRYYLNGHTGPNRFLPSIRKDVWEETIPRVETTLEQIPHGTAFLSPQTSIPIREERKPLDEYEVLEREAIQAQ